MARIPVRRPRANRSTSSAPDALRALGFTDPGARPTPGTSIPDLLLYALILGPSPRPDLDMVLVVAGELEALCMFVEGPLHTSLESMSRRLRAAVDLARRLAAIAEGQ